MDRHQPPARRCIQRRLRSLDALHDFYVPQFRTKTDLVPGMVTYFWITPTWTGTFDIIVEKEEAYRDGATWPPPTWQPAAWSFPLI